MLRLRNPRFAGGFVQNDLWLWNNRPANKSPTARTIMTSSILDAPTNDTRLKVVDIPIRLVRLEEGLGRQRSRDGHEQLQRSIEQFGVLTPITVRPAPDESGEFLLVKGQGRTLACRLLGLASIPAIVLGAAEGESRKVQEFLVENVARLRMSPTDRALLMRRARQEGEETAQIARRFGVATSTARKLLAQLEDASSSEVIALRAGRLTLAAQAVVYRHVASADRELATEIVAECGIRARDLDHLFAALGWRDLTALGEGYRRDRIALLRWACHRYQQSSGAARDRLRAIAAVFPMDLTTQTSGEALRAT